MKCPKCHFDNPENSNFCFECGTKLEQKCPGCNVSLPTGVKFCNNCGFDLRKPQKTAPINYSEPQSYTPKHLADKILTNRSSIEGERKLVTVLFADIANFTNISEKLEPDEVHQIMNGFFEILMNEIHKYEGTINQFTGDGIMALFGAPVAHENHAQRACYAALAIQNALKAYSEKIERECQIDFKMRIGLNSGPVIVGSIGDDLRMDYTAVGDTTNLASRMETLSKAGCITISGNTYKIVKDYFDIEPLGKVEVKGKEDPQNTYQVVSAKDIETRFEASVSKGLTKFVGRKNSMAALMEVYDKVKTGLGQVVGVVGEAGVGKSRVLLEFKNQLPKDEYIYLVGRCLHYGGAMAYLPILEILKSYFEIKEDVREFVIKKNMKEKLHQLNEKLESHIPSFQDLLSLKVDDESYQQLEPKVKRDKAFEAIRDLIIRLSEDKILVLAIEDLHWIDKTSEEFLNYLIGWIANSKVMLILIYRPEYTHQWGSKSYYNRIGIDQLGADSSTELVYAMLEGGEVASELKSLILERAAGNPLFMEEFTHTLLENGTIEKKDHQYVLNREISDIQVPGTIQGIIAARMDRLEDNLKRTLQIASVIGRDFAFRILKMITGIDEELKSYLLNLQGLEFIYEKKLFPELEYIFKHILIQEVAYNSLIQKRKKEIHEKIGNVIEEIYIDRLEEFYEILAYHYSKSENYEKAYQFFKLSAEKVFTNHSNWESFRLYKEALIALKQLPDTDDNKKKMLEIYLDMYGPMLLLTFPEDSLEIFQEAEKLSRDFEDKQLHAKCCANVGNYYTFKGDPLLARRYFEDAFYEASEMQDFELMVYLGHTLCLSYQAAGDALKLLDIGPDLVSLIEKNQKEFDCDKFGFNRYSWLSSVTGLTYGFIGKFDIGKIYIEKGLRVAEKVNDLFMIGDIEQHYSIFYQIRYDWNQTIHHAQKSIQYLEKINMPWLLGVSLGALGMGYYYYGDLKTALSFIEKGLKIVIESNTMWDLSWFNIQLSHVHHDLGNITEAIKCSEQALEMSKKYKDKSSEGFSMIWLGRLLGRKDISQNKKAEDYIKLGISLIEELKMNNFVHEGYIWLGELYIDSTKYKSAIECFKNARNYFNEKEVYYLLSFTNSYLGLAIFKENPSNIDEAQDLILDAIKIAKEIESKPPLAMGYLCLGELYADNGQKEKALENLKIAESMYQEMKMGLWLGKTREIMNRL